MTKAPAPTRNSMGDIVGSWTVRLSYDEASDRLHLAIHRPSTRWLKATTSIVTFEPHDLEDMLAAAQVAVRTLGARRLF